MICTLKFWDEEVNGDRTFNEWHDYIHAEDRDETIKDFYSTIENPSKDFGQRNTGF